MPKTLRITTYNIHKGLSALNRHHVLPRIKAALDGLESDIVFLQEVQGAHARHAQRFADWPQAPQHQVLADGHHHAYGRNAEYHSGHHGNALISRYPILHSHNLDISVNSLEQRGLLHGRLALPGREQALDVLCVHLNLRAPDRRRQIEQVARYVDAHIPPDAPLILAGDFNDWRREACAALHAALGLEDAFRSCHGKLAATFPARMPLLPLDRIYLRGFTVDEATLHRAGDWARLSDHAALSARIRWPALAAAKR